MPPAHFPEPHLLYEARCSHLQLLNTSSTGPLLFFVLKPMALLTTKLTVLTIVLTTSKARKCSANDRGTRSVLYQLDPESSKPDTGRGPIHVTP